MKPDLHAVVVGLGYVGLPLAMALARRFVAVGFDTDPERVAEIRSGRDRTGEVDAAALRASTLGVTCDEREIVGRDIYFVTVPTPIDGENRPDLGPLETASVTVGRALRPGALVVYESTVYPGVTEGFCGPILERESGLRCGRDFALGYSPERINPGDEAHTLDRITKVVAGQSPEATDRLAAIYGEITGGNVFRARDIRTAEVAKVIENAQRDINIAFINEVAIICKRLGLSTLDVLSAASTKWNFLDFRPGLVGGHCIGVDPYYLAHCARELGHEPEVILAGRRINEGMGALIAGSILEALDGTGARRAGARVLVLGLTFKENVPDLRNSKVIDLIRHLRAGGCEVEAHDPLADAEDARTLHGIALRTALDGLGRYDCVVGAVAHREYRAFGPAALVRLLRPGGLVADVKGLWRDLVLPEGLRYWSL